MGEQKPLLEFNDRQELTREQVEPKVNPWIMTMNLLLFIFLAVASLYAIVLIGISLADRLSMMNLSAASKDPILKKYFQGSKFKGFELAHLFPSSLQDIVAISALLQRIQEALPYHVFTLILTFYIWKQAFAIPGSAMLNLLVGILYGPLYGTLLACILTALGSSFCYLFSATFGGAIILEAFIGSTRLASLKKAVQRHQENVLFYCLFVRLFPFTPNWLFNIAAPSLQIPLSIFFFTSLLGSIPYNSTCTQAGAILSSLQATSDIFTPAVMAKFCVIALIALIPALVRDKYFKNMKPE
jgi:uncharacterized membrane protein YdjX (TVP38/TMEM64 family)